MVTSPSSSTINDNVAAPVFEDLSAKTRHTNSVTISNEDYYDALRVISTNLDVVPRFGSLLLTFAHLNARSSRHSKFGFEVRRANSNLLQCEMCGIESKCVLAQLDMSSLLRESILMCHLSASPFRLWDYDEKFENIFMGACFECNDIKIDF